MDKACTLCGLVQVLEQFSPDKRKRDGKASICKTCYREKVRVWRELNPNKVKKLNRRMNGRRKNKKARALAKRINEEYDPVKRQAMELAHAAFEKGLIAKEPCHVCGSAESEKHHPDYSKPLDVVWLCRRDHKRVHAGRFSLVLRNRDKQRLSVSE